MIENVMRSLLPVVLLRFRDIDRTKKQLYAQFVLMLCEAYIENRKADFSALLSKAEIDPVTCKHIIEGLWSEDTAAAARANSGQNGKR